MRKRGFSTGGIVAIVIIVAILVVGTFLIINFNNKKDQEQANYATYIGEGIIEGNEDNGQIADHVLGNAEAPVIITEYANFQCNHCADMRSMVKKAIENSNGQLGVVFRNLTWSAFQNSKAAAAAAEAAGLQGYWEPYAEKLFSQQAEWSYAKGDERTQLFTKYFEEVTDGKGDVEKFKSDMESEAVQQKVKFDAEVGTAEGAQGTPNFFFEGQFIDLTNGGNLRIGEKDVHYDKIDTAEDFNELIQSIISAQTGA